MNRRLDRGTRGRRSSAAWNIATVNVTSWSAMLDVLQDLNLRRKKFDIICVQELMRPVEDEQQFDMQANRQGYLLAVHGARRTTAGGLTSGVGILTPFHLGLEVAQLLDTITEPARERMVARLWSGFSGRTILVVSLYLFTGQGMHADNMYMLEQLGA